VSAKQDAGAADQPRGWVALVGAGPGDEGLLTVRAAELLAAADVIVAGPEHQALAERAMSADAQLTELADGTPATVARQLTGPAKAGQLVVRLYPGDPLLSGAAQDAAACAKAGVRFEIIAGVPAHTAVPAAAGIALNSNNTGELRVIHASEASRVAYSPATLIVLGADAGPADLAKMLIANGWPESARVAITWDGTTSAQQTVSTTLGHIGPDLKAAGISLANTQGQAIAVVGDAVASRERLSWFETKPLFGWRVLVPRTKEQAAAVSERLREYGAVPEEVPTIAVEPPRTPQQMERAVKGLVTGRYQWVAFTSANAVRAVRERFEEYGLDARAFAGVKVAAVGEQTASSLLDFGIRPDLVPAGEQSAEGLANEWPPYDDLLDPINRVLLPRADIATETLLAKLTDLGWECEDVTAYRTVRAAPPPAPIREAIKGGGFDAVLFTSSSTVRNLVGIAGKPHAVTVIGVIGPQTAKTAAEFGLRVDVTAPKPSMTALVDAMAEYGRGLQQAAEESGEQLRRPSERRRGGRRRR
jgi:uroporphyrinogen III methyltransferase/synthase